MRRVKLLIVLATCLASPAASTLLVGVPGTTVLSNSSTSGSILVDGGALVGITGACQFVIGAAGAETTLYNILEDGDAGFTTFRVYGAHTTPGSLNIK